MGIFIVLSRVFRTSDVAFFMLVGWSLSGRGHVQADGARPTMYYLQCTFYKLRFKSEIV